MASNPRGSKVGAYQTSLKELWDGADKDHWEVEAKDEMKDVYEYVASYLC